MKPQHLLSLLLLLPALAQAELYKSIDENGRVTYSNKPLRGSKRLTPPDSQGVNYGERRRSSAAHNPSPDNFPKIDRGTQKNRDQSRLRILQTELASEEKLLQEARRNQKEVEANKTDPKREEKLKSLATEIRVHEKNIEALNTELAKIK